MNYKYSILTLIFWFLGLFSILAQNLPVIITGKIVESENNIPIEFATVLIADVATKKPITGVTTNEKGEFELISNKQNFYIEVHFIGFKTKTISKFNIKNNKIKLGIITLVEDAAALDEVVIRAEKSQTVFKLDKRVFHVGKDISSTGASALEVLNNVPSVNVNIEGAISLRGSQGVQILINGKPSVIAESNALGTITADMIDRIEVITNPSAKYDAEGTSGIINIVIKKSEKKGLNGSVTLNTGIPNNHSIGLSLNKRTEKFNLFSQIGYGRRTFPYKSESKSIDRVHNTSVSNDGISDKNEKFFNLILGTDYHINALNVLTLSGHYAFENELENSDKNYSFINEQILTDSWSRKELTTATNPKWEYELQYKKDFKDNKDRNLLFSALGKSFSKDKYSTFQNTTSFGNNPNDLQRAHINFIQAKYTFKLDYTQPIKDKFTIEMGSQYVINDMSNDYSIDDFIGDSWINNTNYTNVFKYSQGVLGVYTTTAYEGDKWGLKLGLRLENTNLKTELINTNETNNQVYSNLFPSAHTSYKITDLFSIQAGYSKRIFRPRLWSLNPFTSFRDNYNVSRGNPNLNPEYTDSFEITSIYKFEKASLNFGIYHRATTDVIERVILFENNVSTSTKENIGTNNTTGIELNAKYNPISWFTFTTDLNFNSYKRKGSFEQNSFNFTGQQWAAKGTGKFKLPAKFAVEITGNYRSKHKTVQQTLSDNSFMNLGIRKKMMKGKLVASLSVRDVFNSRKRESIADEENFYRLTNGQQGRFVIFGLSYGFGKGEAMEFSGKKNF